MFACCVCQWEFASEFVPAFDMRTGQPVCPRCEEERKDWRSRLVFPEPVVRMAELPNGEAW